MVHIGNEGADEYLFDCVFDGLDDIEGTSKNNGVLDGVDVRLDEGTDVGDAS